MDRYKKTFWSLLIFLTIIICSCSVKTVNNFYVLSYVPSIDKDLISHNNLFPLKDKLEVVDFDMNRIYDRNSIVIRESLHRMTFDEKNKWALRPDKSVTELLVSHFTAYGIFSECKNDFVGVSPDYHLTGRINNMEKYQSDKFSFAYININIFFRDKEKNIILTHDINRRIKLKTDDTSYFVKMLSDALKEETEILIGKIVKNLEK